MSENDQAIDARTVLNRMFMRAIDGATLEAVRQYSKTIAAVAELIEADREYDRARSAMVALAQAGPRPYSYGTGWELRDAATRRELQAAFEAAEQRRAAALARCGGTKP